MHLAVERLLEQLRMHDPKNLDAAKEAFDDIAGALRLFVLPSKGSTTHTQRIAHRAAWELLQAVDDAKEAFFHPGTSYPNSLEPVVRALRALATLLDVVSLAVMG
jgi:hypothetical protein